MSNNKKVMSQWRNDRPGYPGVAGGATQSGAPNYQFFEKTFRVLNGEQVNFPYPSLRTRSFLPFPGELL